MTSFPQNFDPMRGPATEAYGAEGVVQVGGLTVGRLTSWKVVISPTTGKPTLIGEGKFQRYYRQAIGGRVMASVIPSQPPYRIGRKRPPVPKPFLLAGTLVRLTAAGVTIASGEIQRMRG